MFARIDDWLFRRVFEPIAHEFEAWTGLTNFVLAWAAFITWSAGIISQVFVRTGSWDQFFWIGASAVIPLLLIATYYELRASERRANRTSRFCNPAKAHPIYRSTRALSLALVLLTVLFFFLPPIRFSAMDVATVAYCAGSYFRACDPMPPNKQRSLALWRSAQTQPTGA